MGVNSESTYADCVRFLMDECDKAGCLHHEVLEGFVSDVNYDHFTNEENSLKAPPLFRRALEALWEWDV